jgi:nicotinate-nucleotide--dimethylbenzimidazole phosphoribosyltransferase
MQALAYGMMAVQPGIDLLCLCLPNPVAADCAQAVGEAIAKGQEPLDALMRFGGYDLAAATGAALAARLAKAPVLAEGSAAAVCDILRALSPAAAAHIRRCEDILPQTPHLQAGEGSALALGLLKSIAAAG